MSNKLKTSDIKRNSTIQTKTHKKQRPSQTAVSDPTLLLKKTNLSLQEAQTLQRTIGNQALRRLTVQPKITVGPVGDKYEQEADAVAKQVVSKLHASPVQKPTATAQRQEEEELQMKPLPVISTLQRQEEEELQAKNETPKSDPMLAGGELSSDIEGSVQSAKSGGQSLDNTIRQPMEKAFSADFSNIKIHTGNTADSLNRSLSARAFTSGQDIFFRNGEYNPGNSGGQELLAHELTHTVQQGAAPIQHHPTKETTSNYNQRSAPTFNTTSPQNIIQAYRIINFNDYDIGATGAIFKSQEVERTNRSARHITKSKEIHQNDLGLSSQSETKAMKSGDTIAQEEEAVGHGTGPALKVSKTGEIAIEDTAGEAKLFYATNNIVENSNTKLRSIGSTISLSIDDNQSLSVPDAEGTRHPVKAVEPLVNNRIPETIGNVSICTDFIKNVLGAADNASRVAVFQKANWEDGLNTNPTYEAPVSNSEEEPVKAIIEKIDDGNPQGGSSMKQSLAPRNNTDSNTPNENVIATYQNMSKSKLGGQERALGINKYAQPDVGEGFVTSSIRERPDEGATLSTIRFQQALDLIENGTETQKRNMEKNSRALQHLWGIHYAGVVAKSGSDTVTLENYNRENVLRWELDTLLTNIFKEFAVFRGLVRDAIQQEKHGMKDGIPVDTRQRITQFRKVITEAQNMQYLGNDLEERLQAFTDSYQGLIVNQNKLFHFKMYGSEEGQSFHEQWQGETENSVTLRIRESRPILAETIVQKIQTKTNQAIATFIGLGTNVNGLNPIMRQITERIMRLGDDIILSIDMSPHKAEYKGAETQFGLLLKREAKEGLLQIFDHAKGIAEKPDAELGHDPTTDEALTYLDRWILSNSSFSLRNRKTRQRKVTQLTTIREIVQQTKGFFSI